MQKVNAYCDEALNNDSKLQYQGKRKSVLVNA